jgi:hypothetical protein
MGTASASAARQEVEATTGFEPVNSGFAGLAMPSADVPPTSRFEREAGLGNGP